MLENLLSPNKHFEEKLLNYSQMYTSDLDYILLADVVSSSTNPVI